LRDCRPDDAFVDHQLHDVDTGGWVKTRTPTNADFNAPYFHDGRFENSDQVANYFDRYYDFGLSTQERSDPRFLP
jgi:hypothetical protein